MLQLHEIINTINALEVTQDDIKHATDAHIDSKRDIADLELLIALAQDRIKTLKKEYKA